MTRKTPRTTTLASRRSAARGDHARQCVVQTGRMSSNLGRKPDSPGRSHSRARLEVPRPNHALTTVVTSGATPQRRGITHATHVTTPVSAWSRRDACPPTSGVSPIRRGARLMITSSPVKLSNSDRPPDALPRASERSLYLPNRTLDPDGDKIHPIGIAIATNFARSKKRQP